ncbi:MAG: acyltransferase [bacterium]
MDNRTKKDRLVSLDGLRGLCALMVVFSHLNIDKTVVDRVAPGWWMLVQPFVGAGTLYVAVLFVLTGFLMSSIYDRVFSWSGFMQKRYTRLFPLFIVVAIFQTYFYFHVTTQKDRPFAPAIIALCIMFAIVCGTMWRVYIKYRTKSSGKALFYGFFSMQIITLFAYVFIVMRQPADFIHSNYLFFKLFTGMTNVTLTFPFGTYIPMTNGSYWSLVPEIIYYAIYPLVVIPYINLIRKTQANRNIWLIISLCCILTTFTIAFKDLLGLKGLYPHFWLYFFIGNILAVKLDSLQAKCEQLEKYKVFDIVLTLFSIVPFIAFPLLSSVANTPNNSILYMIFAPFPLLLTFSALRSNSLISRILRTRALVFVGSISYSMYLTHIMVIELLRGGPTISAAWSVYDVFSYVAMALTGSVLLAIIFYQLLEKPYFVSRAHQKLIHDPNQYGHASSKGFKLFFALYILLIFSGLQREYSLTSTTHLQSDAHLANAAELPDSVSFLDTDRLSIYITAADNNFGILSIPIQYMGTRTTQNKGDLTGAHSITVTVSDETTGVEISRNTYLGTQFDVEPKHYPFGFPRQTSSKRRVYRVLIESFRATTNDYTAIYELPSNLFGVYQLDKMSLVRSPVMFASVLWHKVSLMLIDPDLWIILALNVIPVATYVGYKRPRPAY